MKDLKRSGLQDGWDEDAEGDFGATDDAVLELLVEEVHGLSALFLLAQVDVGDGGKLGDFAQE